MSPDIGLYQTKYAGRRLLDRIPGIERLEPNLVSIASLVPSTIAAVALVQGWWPLVTLGIVGRMVLSTLDGHIAENYGKKTRLGGYVNRVPAEIGDVLLMLALFTRAEPMWAALALAGSWLVNMLGVLPLVAAGSTQSVGPAGQTDRVALIAIAALIALVVPVDWTLICQVLVVLIVPTLLLRVRRTTRELRDE